MSKGAAYSITGGALGAVFALVLGVTMFGGGNSIASVAPGLRVDQVPEPYRPWVIKAGGLCPDVVGPATIAAQIEAESNWNPNAASDVAEGISQFIPETWLTWGHDEDGNHDGPPGHWDLGSPYDPPDAIMAQGRFMCALVDTVRGYLQDGSVQGDVLDLALAAYNAGPGAVHKAGGVPHNGETEIYVAKIRRLMGHYAAATVPSGDGAFGGKIVMAGATQLGKPYVWGGGNFTGPTGGGFDCSGLVMYALYQASGGKIALAQHLADWQVTQGAPVAGPAPGSAIDLAQLQPGDIIGFADSPGARYHHIGIYAGNGQLLHAPETGDVVKVAPLASSYWAHQIWNVRRFG